jgi:dephospho-CoA kinase
MIVIGLTGSIAMGKSTTANLFAQAGVPVQEADAVVHRLYQGDAVAAIEEAFPGVTHAGRVDRAALADRVLDDTAALKRLEAIVHPMVRTAQARFVAEWAARGARMVVLDIPLLFETAPESQVDVIVVVSAPSHLQRARTLARPGMTAEKFEAILARQTPDSEKRARAHFVVDTSRGVDSARAQVHGILRALAAMPGRRPSSP